MRTIDAASVALVVGIAVQAPSSFQALTSAVVSIRTHAASGGCNRDVRDAEVISAAVVGLVGAAASIILRHPAPLIAAVLADTALVGIYEYALRTQHYEGMNGNGRDDTAAGF